MYAKALRRLFSLTLFASLTATSLTASGQDVVRKEHPQGLAVPSGTGWQPLFNGKDLSGWKQNNGWAVYRIVDGTIEGTTSKDSPNSFLCTERNYKNFELRFSVKVDDPLNSGVQIRSKSLPDHDSGRVHGPQVEIESTGGTAGYIYGEATGRNWISPSQPPHKHFRRGEWNQYVIRAEGNHFQTWINGQIIEDFTDAKAFDEGFIGLQVHGIAPDQGPFRVQWKDVELRELK